MDLKGRHLISTGDWNNEELETLLECASDLKAKMKRSIPHKYLDSKTLMIFPAVGSPLVRSAFESGIVQLGGHASTINRSAMEPPFRMDAPDVGRVASRHAHGMAIAYYLDEIPGPAAGEAGTWDVRAIARSASVPVFNMMSSLYDPVQAIADLMTVRERFGSNLSGLRFVCSWAHSTAPAWRIPTAQSLVLLMTRFGMKVVLAHPPEFGLDAGIVDQAKENAAGSGGSFVMVADMDDAFKGASVVYPVSWPCLGEPASSDETQPAADHYVSWTCDARRMDLLAEDGTYMHCMPARRGFEVDGAVIDGPRSVVLDQAENVLHAAKALMALTM
jgi:ornithine carbamoyltransferase